MELNFYCVMCRSMATINRLSMPTVAVVKTQIFPLVAEREKDEQFLIFKYNFVYVKFHKE